MHSCTLGQEKKIQENVNEGKQIAIFQANCLVENESNIPWQQSTLILKGQKFVNYLNQV